MQPSLNKQKWMVQRSKIACETMFYGLIPVLISALNKVRICLNRPFIFVADDVPYTSVTAMHTYVRV